MAKPLSREMPSDDLEVAYGGVTCRPHEGESVWIWPDSSIEFYRLGLEMGALKARIDALEGDDDADEAAISLVQGTFLPLAARLASRIDRWTWTDLRGNPLPQPTADLLAGLETEELTWLAGAVRGQTQEQRKNDSPGSRITSSDTAPPPSPAVSSSARSRSRA